MNYVIELLQKELTTTNNKDAREQIAEVLKIIKLPKNAITIMQECIEKHGFDFSIEQVRSADRNPILVNLRHLICIDLSKSGYNKSQIGRFINRDHSTVSKNIYHRVPFKTNNI